MRWLQHAMYMHTHVSALAAGAMRHCVLVGLCLRVSQLAAAPRPLLHPSQAAWRAQAVWLKVQPREDAAVTQMCGRYDTRGAESGTTFLCRTTCNPPHHRAAATNPALHPPARQPGGPRLCSLEMQQWDKACSRSGQGGQRVGPPKQVSRQHRHAHLSAAEQHIEHHGRILVLMLTI